VKLVLSQTSLPLRGKGASYDRGKRSGDREGIFSKQRPARREWKKAQKKVALRGGGKGTIGSPLSERVAGPRVRSKDAGEKHRATWRADLKVLKGVQFKTEEGTAPGNVLARAMPETTNTP